VPFREEFSSPVKQVDVPILLELQLDQNGSARHTDVSRDALKGIIASRSMAGFDPSSKEFKTKAKLGC
jgi:hypothetical protein